MRGILLENITAAVVGDVTMVGNARGTAEKMG
jgi:hypothetical protein